MRRDEGMRAAVGALELGDELLGRPITGRNLTGRTLGEELGERPVLLAFLRHFG